MLDPLDHDAPGPAVPQPGEVVDRGARVEHPVHEVCDRPAGLAKRGELQRLGGEQVEPPGGVDGHVRQRPGGQARWDRHAVAHVPQPPTRHGGVHGQHQRAVAGGRRTLDQGERGDTVLPQVELEPVLATGCRGGDVLQRHGPHRRQRVGDPGAGRRAGDRTLTLVVHHPRETGGGEDQRQRAGGADHGAGRVHRGDVTQHAGPKPYVGVGLPRPTQAGLHLGGTVDVVEDRPGGAASSHGTQVADGGGTGEETVGAVALARADLDQGPQLRPTGTPSLRAHREHLFSAEPERGLEWSCPRPNQGRGYSASRTGVRPSSALLPDRDLGGRVESARWPE